MICSNCSGERSFSTLNLIKNHLRSEMKDDRLSAGSIMNIEARVVNIIEFDDILKCFHQQKTEKGMLS